MSASHETPGGGRPAAPSSLGSPHATAQGLGAPFTMRVIPREPALAWFLQPLECERCHGEFVPAAPSFVPRFCPTCRAIRKGLGSKAARLRNLAARRARLARRFGTGEGR